MNKLWLLLPIIVGSTIVVQSGLNDKVQKEHGLIYAMILNNLVFLMITSILLCLHYFDQLHGKTLDFRKILDFNWWYILPGVMGAIIVGGSALSFDKIGAAKTMIILIAAQVVISLVWDYFAKGTAINGYKIVAAVLSISGAFIVSK